MRPATLGHILGVLCSMTLLLGVCGCSHEDGLDVEEREASSGTKSIKVRLDNQCLTAYEGTTAVNSFFISSGPGSKFTPKIGSTIWHRLKEQTMTGYQAGGVHVRWVQYWGPEKPPADHPNYRDLAIHSVPDGYGESMIGSPWGAGCIVMRTAEAEWLYGWSHYGLKVSVSSGSGPCSATSGNTTVGGTSGSGGSVAGGTQCRTDHGLIAGTCSSTTGICDGNADQICGTTIDCLPCTCTGGATSTVEAGHVCSKDPNKHNKPWSEVSATATPTPSPTPSATPASGSVPATSSQQCPPSNGQVQSNTCALVGGVKTCAAGQACGNFVQQSSGSSGEWSCTKCRCGTKEIDLGQTC